MNETKTFSIRADLTGKVEARVARLNRRAARLGVEPITFIKSVPVLKEVRVVDEIREDDDKPKTVWLEFVDVTISLNVPKLADWDFVCTIQHLAEGANILLTVPGKEGLDLSAYRTCRPNCEHCNKARVRSDTYVVRHLDGTMKQVGNDCLASFTGYCGTPEQAASLASWLSDTISFCEDPCDEDSDGGYGMGGSAGVSLDRFLSFVVAASNRWGFRSRKEASLTGKSCTADDAQTSMEPPVGIRKDALVTPTDEDVAFAKEARAWAASIEPRSDFDHNLKTVASCDGVLYRNLGIAAYLVQAYRKHLGMVAERAARAARPASNHFGTEGVRLRKLKLTLAGIHGFDSQFGTMFIHRFVTEDGNDAVWKTSTDALCEVGESVTVDATVKKHGDYKGRLQTELTRVKVVAP